MDDGSAGERLERRLELLEEELANASGEDQRERLRAELLAVHRRLDALDTVRADAMQQVSSSAATRSTEGRTAPVPLVTREPAKPDVHGYYPDPFSSLGLLPYQDGSRWDNGTQPPGGPSLDDLEVPRRRRRTVEPVASERVALQATGIRAGFYLDPFAKGEYERHFDGLRWGDATHPAGGPSLDDLGIAEHERVLTEGATSSQVRPSRLGYYNDPFSGAGYQRHFDGRRWGDSTHPIGGPTLESLGVSEQASQAAGLPPVASGGSGRRQQDQQDQQDRSVDVTVNRAAVTGFVFGLLSILLYDVGLVPLVAVVASAVGLGTYRKCQQSGRWMGVVGLVLGCSYTFMYLVAYGHIALAAL